MNALHLTSFLIAFVVGFVAIKKFGISDKDFLETIYGKRDNSAARTKNDSKIDMYLEIDGEESVSGLDKILSTLNLLNLGEKLPSKLLENTKMPKKKFTRLLQSLLNQGLISYVDTNIILNHILKTNSTIIITTKGQNVLEYFKGSDKFIYEIKTQTQENENWKS